MRVRPPALTLLTAATAIAVGVMMSTTANAATPLAGAHGATASSTTASSTPAITQHPTARACAIPTKRNVFACDAIIRTDIKGVRANAIVAGRHPVRLRPVQPGQRVQAVHDRRLRRHGRDRRRVQRPERRRRTWPTYRSQFGLPACTVANGCFKQLNQNGATSPLPSNDSGWAGEESLDLDMVSAICPNCHIISSRPARRQQRQPVHRGEPRGHAGREVRVQQLGRRENTPVRPPTTPTSTTPASRSPSAPVTTRPVPNSRPPRSTSRRSAAPR